MYSNDDTRTDDQIEWDLVDAIEQQNAEIEAILAEMKAILAEMKQCPSQNRK